tara:strand:- start:5285 stop:5782 length:498 start_codon:yes stop_codon:yes gene_type:complete
MKMYEPFQFLTTEECDNIINYALKGEIRQGATVGAGAQIKRKNRIVWYNDSSKWQDWISLFNRIEKRIDWIETPQIAFYKPGEKYDWHTDQGASRRTHQRLWTLTCELQTALDGSIEVKDRSIPKLSKGQAIIFPSVDKHRATSPSSGERISLTIWAMAKNYHGV